MIGIAIHNFNGCSFDIAYRSLTKDGIAHMSAEDIERLVADGRVLVVVTDEELSGEDEDMMIFSACSHAEQTMETVLPEFIVSRDRCGYACLLAVYAQPDDRDLPLLDRDEIDVRTPQEALEAIRDVGTDPELMEDLLDMAFANRYWEVCESITRSVLRGLEMTPERIHWVLEQRHATLDDPTPLLLGLVEKPARFEQPDGINRKGRARVRLLRIIDDHPEYRQKDQELLVGLASAWYQASSRIGSVFWQRFPEKQDDEVIHAEDVIAAMCLEDAKTAIVAGVPIEDVIC